MNILTENKSWTILNVETGKVWEVNHQEFKNLLDLPGSSLKGEYQVVNVKGLNSRIWIDMTIFGKGE